MEITLYQTLEDRENPEEIEEDGPFPCNFPTAWLGFGYYFWDSHIALGHWWGQLNYLPQGYVISRAYGDLDESCLDLHGNGRHRQAFEDACQEIIGSKISTKERLLVPQVIEYLKKAEKIPF